MSDIHDRTIYHRENIGDGDDTPALTVAERIRLLGLRTSLAKLAHDRPNGLVQTFMANNIEMGFWALGSDGDTFDVTIVGIPPILELSKADYINGPPLKRLLKLNCTLGTATEAANKNPITYATVASSTFRAVDTLVVEVEGTGYQLRDAGGSNGLARVIFDPLACPHVFAYADNFSSTTRVDIWAQRVTARF